MAEETLSLLHEDGRLEPLAFERWLAAASHEDLEVLELATAPVLDVGCGPGRHAAALARSGVAVLGIDVAPSAVRLARCQGACVLQRSVFDRVPGTGRWSTLLLLDGNIGIGADPAALLMRARELLSPYGRVLMEVARPSQESCNLTLCLQVFGMPAERLPWAQVGARDVDRLASESGFKTRRVWASGERWFAWLDSCTDRRGS
ncbi:MAG: methyltransferase domain-containing protein [Actinomycetota bacterium]|nr:methyltransferase domain-containing protein [Actinomycetota bacterium]